LLAARDNFSNRNSWKNWRYLVNNYEGMIVIKSDLDKDLKKKTMDFISNAITKEGGNIKDVSEWGKNKLAYKIKKQKDGLYILMHFSVTGDKLNKIQKAYTLNEEILKALIIENEDKVNV